MSSPVYRSPLTPALPESPGDHRRWGRLYGSSLGLVIGRSAEEHGGPVVVVTPDTPSAHRLEEELRFFLSKEVSILHFPDWETLPYDLFSPHQDIISERLATLYQLPGLERGLLIVPVTTLMVRLAPREYLEANSLVLERGQRLEIENMRQRLEAGGYRCVSQVMEHGEFAVRGSVFDLYPMGGALPYRIELFDDEVESIRTFDPDSQRSRDKVERVNLLPAREFPLSEKAIARFRQAWRARFEGDPTACPVYRDVSDGLAPSGIEYLLPLFFERTATLFDYLPPSSLVVTLAGVHDASQAFWAETGERYEQGRHDRERPLLPPQEIFQDAGEIFGHLKAFPLINIGTFEDEQRPRVANYATRAPTRLPIDARATDPLGPLKSFLSRFDGRVLVVAETPGRREVLLETFREHGLQPAPFESWSQFLAGEAEFGITVAPLESAAIVEEPPLAVITESVLFGERAMQRRRRKVVGRDAETLVRDLTELNVGAPVVHEDHGVGRYQGLQTLKVGDLTTEFLTLEYADGDKLYVPVSCLHLIGRYTGADPEHAPLHKLGSPQWQKAKRKAAEKVYDVAAELLEVQARREARKGHAFALEPHQYQAFVQAFPFEETPDQQTAIDQVTADLVGQRPMDRLVCGDVGFGKTEVAMRAAYIAIQDGWQVAVLVPTTLLAQQHYQNFKDRFADWPVRIEQLSRFLSKKQQDAIVGDLAAGKVDVVIGTHRLLQDNIGFKRLGLIVIDEEHRFGVRHKERFKALRAEVDLLTLTATPIPRTLNMALSGLRELSLIATPPARRLSIKTFVRQWDDRVLREACLREIKRGGQVFFLHNEVDSIDRMARQVEELVPEATVRIAHGQMRERDLEQAMLDFYHRRFNVLVCTTIIETGIDVPSANTIVINRADRFGLAQLHQLRGRVGRSHHRAYAYLIVPHPRAMTADATKRLEAIESLEDLGIGFTLATHDLEIRGAGELLGHGQSGHLQEVGYGLYTQLLERAVQALKAGRSPQLDRPLDHGTEIDLHVPALIPEDYLPDVHTRLIMYKRIASADSVEQLRELHVEMIDRFGLLPEPTKTLFRVTELKLKATPLGIRKIDLGSRGGRVHFDPEPNIDPARVIRLVQYQSQTYRMDGGDKLRVNREMPTTDSRISVLETLLQELGTRDAA